MKRGSSSASLHLRYLQPTFQPRHCSDLDGERQQQRKPAFVPCTTDSSAPSSFKYRWREAVAVQDCVQPTFQPHHHLSTDGEKVYLIFQPRHHSNLQPAHGFPPMMFFSANWFYWALLQYRTIASTSSENTCNIHQMHQYGQSTQ